MGYFADLMRFFIFFFVISFLLLITYSMSFYISDLVRIFKDPLKIVYIIVYSVILGFYFSAYVVFNVKRGRIPLFISSILTLFYLHDFQRNIFFLHIGKTYSSILFIIYVISGGLALVFSTISLILQLKAGGADIKIIRRNSKKNKPRDSEYFI